MLLYDRLCLLFSLVPGPKICSHLQGCEVEEGEDAHFSIELSVAMIGTWFLNSAQLQHGGRYSIRQTQTHHSLVIRETHTTDDTAEVTFIANGVRDSAVLRVKCGCKNWLFLVYLSHSGWLSLQVHLFYVLVSLQLLW